MTHVLDKVLPAEDGFGAEWDQVSGVIWLIGTDGGKFLISPAEAVRLVRWIVDNDLA